MSDIKKIKLNGVIYNISGGGGTDDYTDLNNKPSINNVTLNGNKSLNDLGINNFSGNYNDLTNKPTIPDELKDLTDDSTHRTVTDTEKTTWNSKSDFSGNYNDLTNKPTIPDVSNYYTKTESEANFADKVYTVANLNGVIGLTDTEAYNQLVFQINRYLNDGNFSLRTKYIESTSRPYMFIYDILNTTRNMSNDYASIDIYAKVIPAGYPIENSSSVAYGVKYATVKIEAWYTAYVPLTEFDNKSITDVYSNTSLTSKGLAGNSTYSFCTFRNYNLNVLGMNNTTAWTPTGDYNPATKKYVDDIVGDINTALENIINGGGN